MSRSGRVALPDVQEWSGGPLISRKWSGGTSGCPGVDGSTSKFSGSGREAF